MKRILNKPIRDEKGQALILALILLVIGGLIIGPLLGYMSTGLITGQVYEERMDELYAADAGVEDAIWQIKTKAAELPQAGDDPPTWKYSIAEDDPVNDKDVSVTIEYVDDVTFKITSTATTENDPTTTDDDSSTTIESYINILDFTLFTDNAITSIGTVDLKSEGEKKAMVYDGDVVYCTGDAPSEEQVIGGDVRNECLQDYWPTAGQLSAFYWEDLQENYPSYTVYPDGTVINVRDTNDIGPLYCEGDLTIKTTNPNEEATLQGTVYVAGNLEFQQTGKNYDIYLDNHTIYVEGEGQPYAINFPSNQCNLYGPGCIIAIHDIFFHPNIEGTDFIFVMSIEGEVQFNPGGDFTGSLAGDVKVDLHPDNTLNWVEPPDDLNLPGFGDKNVITAIRTWEIILQ